MSPVTAIREIIDKPGLDPKVGSVDPTGTATIITSSVAGTQVGPDYILVISSEGATLSKALYSSQRTDVAPTDTSNNPQNYNQQRQQNQGFDANA